ncbi:family 16 glycosylhydrolase [Flagellimonas sp. S3867]|uniref:glycoside hydrolase family 16 protein n=1 Tax=Flagellimonas sp. S3867 TaxID=2768063 RepID=UPI001683B406|nr:glycoside hydrolase family 16 protein [Flagellimonas sp. S3867]
MTKRTLVFILIIIGLILFSSSMHKSLNLGTNSSTTFKTLVWSDEFEDDGPINKEKWFQQTKLPPGGSWWGGLIQHYTDRDDNSHVKDGLLNIVAKKQEFHDQGEVKQFTSARLNSKFAFTYGRVEVRAKLPEGVGTWPAIWMLNKNINEDGAYWQKQGFGEVNWPICGEIDILEHWGKNQDYVQSAVHTAASYGHDVVNLSGKNITSASDEFHVYSVEWTKEKMAFSVDGDIHYVYNPSHKNSDNWPFDTDQYIILNIAIEPDIDPNFVESSMQIDYVRIYQ